MIGQKLRELGIIRPANDVGDGELLHAAWQRWGTQCADRLRGDFTFAIWNPRQQTLYAARDPMGVRPFVFHFVADTTVSFSVPPWKRCWRKATFQNSWTRAVSLMRCSAKPKAST